MNLDELRDAKRTAKLDIENALEVFNADTGLEITAISLTVVDIQAIPGRPRTSRSIASLEVKL